MVPPLTDDNAADDKIGSAVSRVSNRMEYKDIFIKNTNMERIRTVSKERKESNTL